MAKYIPLLIIFFGSFIAGQALLRPGLIPTHDGEYHIVRFYEFNKAILDGDLYPRWAADLNNGYGVPLFNYVYPLPNYAAFAFHVFGISFIDAFKFQMFAAIFIGALFFYLWTKIFWGEIGGLVSSVFYTFSPYHFVDIYIRGSVGEVWALALIPLFLWAVTKVFYTRKKEYTVAAGVALAAIIFSHNILALLFAPVGVSYVALLFLIKRDKKILWHILYVFVLGLFLSSIFWLPAILERSYVVGLEVFDYRQHFPEIFQLFIPSWGSGFSGTGIISNQISFQIGAANLAAVFLSIIVGIRLLAKDKKQSVLIFFFLAWFLICFFLLLKISLPAWRMIPFLSYIQFPWRLLSLEILFSSFLAGGIIFLFKSAKKQLVAGFIFMIFAVAMSVGYATSAYYLARDDNYYTKNPSFMSGTNSIGNAFNTVWATPPYTSSKSKIKRISGTATILSASIKNARYVFLVSVSADAVFRINTAYFPGWAGIVNYYTKPIEKTSDGAMIIKAPKSTTEIRIVLKNTVPRLIGSICLILGALSIFLLFLHDRMKKENLL